LHKQNNEVSARVLNQDEIDSLLGWDSSPKKRKSHPKPPAYSIYFGEYVLWDLKSGRSWLAGRKAWNYSICLRDNQFFIVEKGDIVTDKLWVPTHEDLLANDWETGD